MYARALLPCHSLTSTALSLTPQLPHPHDLQEDNPDQLASEMMQDLSLDVREAETIARMIQHEITRVQAPAPARV